MKARWFKFVEKLVSWLLRPDASVLVVCYTAERRVDCGLLVSDDVAPVLAETLRVLADKIEAGVDPPVAGAAPQTPPRVH